MALLLGSLLLGGTALPAQGQEASPAAVQTQPQTQPQAQTQTQAQAGTQSPGQTASAIADLDPVLDKIGSTLAKVDISGWKLSREGRAAASGDVESIQQDLGKTLPALMETAKASGGQVAPTFAVYRNVDALYDVLLRVTSMANFTAPKAEARGIEQARAALEAARSELGQALGSAAAAQDSEIGKLRVEIARRPPPAPPQTTVINDGPVKKPAKKHARHTKAAPR